MPFTSNKKSSKLTVAKQKPKSKIKLPPKPPIKPKIEVPKVKPIVKPKIKIPDFDIKVEDGNLSDTHSICRCFMVDEGGKELTRLGVEFVSCGFGQSRGKSVEDFIRRNNSNILSKIFERSQQ